MKLASVVGRDIDTQRDEQFRMPASKYSTFLRVLHLGKYFYPDSGGIETVTKDIAQGTARAGCAVSVLCFAQVERTLVEYSFGVDVVRVPIWKALASQPIGWQYYREFQCLSSSFDIVHIHLPNMLAVLALLSSRFHGQVVVHWHSDVVNKGWLGILALPIEQLMLWRADAIIATSQAYASASPLLGQYKDKIYIVPIGIPAPEFFDENGADIGAPFALSVDGLLIRIPDDALIILAVGRLVPYKGFDVLIDAARNLPADSYVVIVGGGELRDELEYRIRRQGLAGRVILAGRLTEESLRALFKRAVLFCLPSVSRAEAFGVVLLEAMAYGLPIVASDIQGSGVPWVNQHGLTGLNVPPGDSTALAVALTQLLEAPERCEEMGRQARLRFEAEFTSELATHRVLAIYEGLLGRCI